MRGTFGNTLLNFLEMVGTCREDSRAGTTRLQTSKDFKLRARRSDHSIMKIQNVREESMR